MSNMSNGRYILVRGKPVPEPDLFKWGAWFQDSEKRIVRQEHIGPSMVSTVFLGLDHNWSDGPPILWETMVFGGKLDQEQNRCSGNKEQAEAMHHDMVERVKAMEILSETT
jgi:hypothetical protein